MSPKLKKYILNIFINLYDCCGYYLIDVIKDDYKC